VVAHAIKTIIRHMADDGGFQFPLVENSDHIIFVTLLRDDQHPLLRFREQNLVRGHIGFACGDQRNIDIDARLRACRHLGR
jgi:hypothetical protein